MDLGQRWSNISDHYNTLQVSPNAEQEVIEAAYRRLARKYHPDVNSAAYANTKMRELNAAYDVLSDPQKRLAYDALRAQMYDKTGRADHDDIPTTSKVLNKGAWWRWLLVIPTFILAILLPGMIVRTIFEPWSVKLSLVAQGVTNGFCVVYFVTIVAPWSKFKVAVSVLFTFLASIGGFFTWASVVGYQGKYYKSSDMSIDILVTLVGSVGALWLIRGRKALPKEGGKYAKRVIYKVLGWGCLVLGILGIIAGFVGPFVGYFKLMGALALLLILVGPLALLTYPFVSAHYTGIWEVGWLIGLPFSWSLIGLSSWLRDKGSHTP